MQKVFPLRPESIPPSMAPNSLIESSRQVIHELLSSLASLTVLAVRFTAQLPLSLVLVRPTWVYPSCQLTGCAGRPAQRRGVECHPFSTSCHSWCEETFPHSYLVISFQLLSTVCVITWSGSCVTLRCVNGFFRLSFAFSVKEGCMG